MQRCQPAGTKCEAAKSGKSVLDISKPILVGLSFFFPPQALDQSSAQCIWMMGKFSFFLFDWCLPWVLENVPSLLNYSRSHIGSWPFFLTVFPESWDMTTWAPKVPPSCCAFPWRGSAHRNSCGHSWQHWLCNFKAQEKWERSFGGGGKKSF